MCHLLPNRRAVRTAQTVVHLPLHVFRERLLGQLRLGHTAFVGIEGSLEHGAVEVGNRKEKYCGKSEGEQEEMNGGRNLGNSRECDEFREGRR